MLRGCGPLLVLPVTNDRLDRKSCRAHQSPEGLKRLARVPPLFFQFRTAGPQRNLQTACDSYRVPAIVARRSFHLALTESAPEVRCGLGPYTAVAFRP